MKIAVTGANGQLGNSLQKHQEKIQADWIFTDIDQLDITNEQTIKLFFNEYKPDIMINCAAYTAVDKAETEKELANTINHNAPKLLAQQSKKNTCQFIHISTDYVFDGKHYRPYNETDECIPNSVYGETKRQGEIACLSANPESVILRTSWLYSEFGSNFMKTMLRLGQEKESLNVVFDQIGTPTYADTLALGIMQIITKYQLNQVWKSGIYHVSNQGVCSWYDFAKWIMEEAKLNCNISPIESKDYPTPANRPYYSVLNKQKFEQTFHYSIPHWRQSAKQCLNALGF